MWDRWSFVAEEGMLADIGAPSPDAHLYLITKQTQVRGNKTALTRQYTVRLHDVVVTLDSKFNNKNSQMKSYNISGTEISYLSMMLGFESFLWTNNPAC